MRKIVAASATRPRNGQDRSLQSILLCAANPQTPSRAGGPDSAGNLPEQTGKQKLVDTGGRVEFTLTACGRATATRYSDDGEPAKTAGTPVLEAIGHAGLSDVIVVVTRYFGGVLLGTGGLVRAYTTATARALESTPRWSRCGVVELRRDRGLPQVYEPSG